MAEGLSVKPVRAITWTEVGGREAPLIQRCAARDEDACAELVNEHQRMVYQLSLNLLGDHNEALDLSQEVFLRVFRTIHTFRGPVGPPHLDLPHRRQPGAQPAALVAAAAPRRSRSRSTSTSATTAILPEQTNGSSPDRVLGQKQLADRIRVALDHLPFDQKTALVLREIDGLSYEEIGFSLGIAVGTVKSRLARARESLRGAIEGRMTLLTCAAVRRRLEAFHDRELPVGEHDRDRRRTSRSARRARRSCASSGRSATRCALAAAPAPADDWTGLQPGVISRMRAEAHESLAARARIACSTTCTWSGSALASTAATFLCGGIVLSMLHFASPERDDSLAAVIAVIARAARDPT